MPDRIIEIRDLVKKYESRNPVLDHVSFSINLAEFVTIHGKSGCGKTTLLNLMGGLDRPTSGDVRIDGKSLTNLSENELARMRLEKIGFVFQDYNLLPDLTIQQNVVLPLRFSRKKDDGRSDGLLRSFDITNIGNETANKVSGGEAQRAAIARAMMNEPKVILADEPTGNLDAENTETVISAFDIVRKEFGTTVVFATHDVELAKRSTMRIYLADGKVTIQTD